MCRLKCPRLYSTSKLCQSVSVLATLVHEGIRTAGRLVVVDVDALEPKVRVTVVGSGRVNAVLVADNLCEA